MSLKNGPKWRIKTAISDLRNPKISKATMIPGALILILLTVIAAQQLSTSWPGIVARTDWSTDAALMVPDEADAAVLINTRGLQVKSRANTVNRWRNTATQNRGADINVWPGEGHGVTDESLRRQKATTVAWMYIDRQRGQALAIEADSGNATPAGEAGEIAWTTSRHDNVTAITQRPEAAALFGRGDASKTLHATADYQQAKRALGKPNTAIAFARWRALPAAARETIGMPLNCDIEKWIALGIDIPREDSATVTIACPHPRGQWGAGPMTKRATSQGDWDLQLNASFRTTWRELEAGNAGPVVRWASWPARTRNEEAANQILDALSGQAKLVYRNDDNGAEWAIILLLKDGRHDQVATALGALANNEERAEGNDDRAYTLKHGGMPDGSVTAWLDRDRITLGNAPVTSGIQDATTDTRVDGTWNSKATTAWAMSVWPTAAPWLGAAAETTMTGTVKAGVNVYRAEITMRQANDGSP